MFRKRREAKRSKLEPLIPQWSPARPWNRSLLTMATNGLSRLLGIFQRLKQRTRPQLPRAAQGRRKI